MSPVFIQTWIYFLVFSWDGRGQGRMVGASTSVYELDGVVRGYHIYRTVWTPLIDGTLQVVWEDANEHNEYSVAITKGGCIVGQEMRYQKYAHFSCRVTLS